jgi:very-short-patch-repair endonuclease
MLRALLIDAGITGFEPQVLITDGDFEARVDLADVQRRLVIEADGFEFHGTRKALVRDCRRHVGLAVLGWTSLRFSWEDIVGDGGYVVDSVRACQGAPPCGQNSIRLAA